MAEQVQTPPRFAVIGGGIAGSTTALHLAGQGIYLSFIDRGDDLVNGPPFCLRHAGESL